MRPFDAKKQIELNKHVTYQVIMLELLQFTKFSLKLIKLEFLKDNLQ